MIVIVIFTTSSLSAILIIQYRNSEKLKIEIANSKIYEQKLIELKELVNSAYQMLDANYQVINSYDEDYSNEIINAVNINRILITLENIRKLKVGDDGFVWIVDFEKPYTVRLNPEKPVLEGDNWEFLIETDTLINIYEFFHNSVSKTNTEAYISFKFYDENNQNTEPFFAYLKLHKELGWIIGSSTDFSYLKDDELEKNNELNSSVTKMIMTSTIVFFLISVISILIFFILKRNEHKNLVY